MFKGIIPCFALFALLGVVGCDSNPTNAPSKSDVQSADAARAKAIDDNPKLTPDQKLMQKRMMGLLPGGRGPMKPPNMTPPKSIPGKGQ